MMETACITITLTGNKLTARTKILGVIFVYWLVTAMLAQRTKARARCGEQRRNQSQRVEG